MKNEPTERMVDAGEVMINLLYAVEVEGHKVAWDYKHKEIAEQYLGGEISTTAAVYLAMEATRKEDGN